MAGGDFTKLAFGSASAAAAGDILKLTQLQVAFRGTAPQSRISVVLVQLDSAPYPRVTLNDCPTAPSDWRLVATSGPPPTTKTTAAAAPPYQVVAVLIYYEKHWGVSTTKTDASRTCTP